MQNKDNKIPIAIVVGALIIAISIYVVYSNTPQAQLMKSCKNIIKNFNFKKNSTEEGIVMTACLNGELK
tara:strand:- start:780 stop:986 length:207 start_codon:yes stop_codon:yes gene_type:complete